MTRLKIRNEVDALIKKVSSEAPMSIRFGLELKANLRALGFQEPEELLFIDASSLTLTEPEQAQLKNYQRKFLPEVIPPRKPRILHGDEIKSIRNLFTPGNVETTVECVRFNTSEDGDASVLIERTDGTALLVFQ